MEMKSMKIYLPPNKHVIYVCVVVCLLRQKMSLDEQNFHHCCHLLLQQSKQLKDGWSWEAVQGSDEGYLRKTALRSVVIDSSPLSNVEGPCSETAPRTSCQSVPDQQGEEKEQPLDSIMDDEDDEDERVCMVSEGSSQVLQYEYHILYSCSYSTPVLYFRAFTLDGRCLSLEAVWNSVHPNFRLLLQKGPLNIISQQEHPLLGQPFFMLHPCRTEEFMRPVLHAAQDQHRITPGQLTSSMQPQLQTEWFYTPSLFHLVHCNVNYMVGFSYLQRSANYLLSWLSVVGPVVGLDVPLRYSTLLHPSVCSIEPD